MKKTFCSAIIVLAVAMFTACDNGSSVSSVEFEEIVQSSSSEEEIVPTSSSEEEIVQSSSSGDRLVDMKQSSSSSVVIPEDWDTICDMGKEYLLSSGRQITPENYIHTMVDLTGLRIYSEEISYCLEREGYERLI